MDRPLKEFLELVTKTVDCQQPIYEFGSRQMKGQEIFADVRSFFKGKKFIGADYIDGPGVDIVLDLHNLDLDDKTAGTIICMEVFEHVREPWIAIREISRVIKDDGLLILTAPMNSRIHGSPHDYWRFTPEGFKVLFDKEGFEHFFIGNNGYEIFPKNIVAIASKTPIDIKAFLIEYKKWNLKWGGRKEYYFKKLYSFIHPFIPTIFTGSAFELWRRHLTTKERKHIKELLVISMPPFMRSILRKIGINLDY